MVERHRLLTALVGIAVAAVISLAVVGKLHAVLGSYGGITRAGIPHGVFQGLFEHLATLALALGVLPMIVAAGWITPRVWKDDSDVTSSTPRPLFWSQPWLRSKPLRHGRA